MHRNELTNEQRDQIIDAYLADSNALKILVVLSIACTTDGVGPLVVVNKKID
ncbi:5520_t:CDS:2 [Cetraspora pellucida]|uniref:5520_t:CDS:1 n=1 Tax=Cetraspora pellucida TaxID=1433469 RepID=A0A9N8Z6C6_9GLOM|nr:5520_t:CDS:2 [Cetraspora pellucida]